MQSGISFIRKSDRQKYLIGLLVLLILAGVYFLKRDSFQVPGVAPITSQFQPKKPQINFTFLDSPIFKELRSYTPVPQFGGQIGQQDPFLPSQ